MRGLTGKVVAVTGATGGIGTAVCRRLIDEGATVYALDARPGELGGFVSVDVTEFRDSDGEFPIAVLFCFIIEHAARAIHRFNGKMPIFDFKGIHVLSIMEPVSRSLPKMLTH